MAICPKNGLTQNEGEFTMMTKLAGKVAAPAAIALMAIALLLILVSARNASAQTTATILGSIKDQSGAVLPGAEVTATHTETGITRTVPANEHGAYRIPALAVGAYSVESRMTGFQTEVRQGITLVIGREAVVDFTLNVGNVAESVTITGEAAQLETTTAVVGAVVDQAQMREMPLNGRSFIELAALQTNAVFTEPAESSAVKGFGRKLAISGQRYASNSFLLDGADINDAAGGSGSAAGTMAGIETVREFKLITNAYDAEYGRHTGGVISAISKSGTNKMFGSVFGFLRNDNLDASKWEDNARGDGTKAEFRRAQFGGSLGGPIITDKSFFFGSYEGLRQAQGETATYTVPSRALRSAVAAGTRAVVPQVRPYWEAYPLPNAGDIDADRGNFFDAAPTDTRQNYFTGRVDHNFSENDSIFFRMVVDNARNNDPLFNVTELAVTGSRYSTLEQTHIYSPAVLGRTHFSFNRTNLRFNDLPRTDTDRFPEVVGRSLGSEADVPGIITITGLTSFGGSTLNPKKHILNTFQFKEEFTWVAGAHSIRFGGQFERFQFNQRSDFYAGGNFTFASVTSFLNGDVTAGNFIRPGSDDIRGWRQSLMGSYLHDDWKLAPGFTLNIGIRHEFITSPTEANNKVSTVRDLSLENMARLTENRIDVGDPYFLNPSLKNFAPRVGFAWTPFGDSKTSVRGGFGTFHDQILFHNYGTAGVRMSPFFSVAEVDQAALTAARPGTRIDFPNMFATQNDLLRANIGSKPQLDGFIFAASQPTVYKWSLDIEREIVSNLSISAGYSAARGTHLGRGAIMFNTNPFIPASNGLTNFILLDSPRLLNDNFGRMRWRLTDATSDYHGLRVNADKRFSGSFQFSSAFTWSKTTDDTSTWSGATDFNEADRRGHLLEKEHALSAFHVPRSWTNSFIIDLPGKDWSGFAGQTLGGWGLSGVVRMNDGYPMNPTSTIIRSRELVSGVQTNITQRFQEGSTINLIADGNQNSARAQSPDAYFDPTQYIYPTFNCASTQDVPNGPCDRTKPIGQYQGTLGRNTLIAPGSATVDLNLRKDTGLPMLGETGKLEFRAEFFNVLNRPNFSIPVLVVFDRTGPAANQPGAGTLARRAESGRIDSTRGNSRQIQLSLRVAF
ncbi:MAG: TonB-dependent receptor [Acidobacteria bacterium]|nr:TonB-dependent receptor [Acidobacteriota bacterium]